jgi:hypothetical protein
MHRILRSSRLIHHQPSSLTLHPLLLSSLLFSSLFFSFHSSGPLIPYIYASSFSLGSGAVCILHQASALQFSAACRYCRIFFSVRIGQVRHAVSPTFISSNSSNQSHLPSYIYIYMHMHLPPLITPFQNIHCRVR